MQKRIEVQLTPRLKTIASLILPGEPMADIGSDHAYLPLYLVKKQIVPSAIAIEVRQEPWAKAKRQVRLHNLEGRIQVRLGDGLQPLLSGEVATVVLAGMGTRTILGILNEAEPILQSVQRLVIQPMAEIPRMREWLYRHHWQLIDEELVREGERYYVILAAEPGTEPLPNPVYLELGPKLLAKRPPLLKTYIEMLIKKEQQVLKILRKENSEKAQKRQLELLTRITEMEEVMKCLSRVKP